MAKPLIVFSDLLPSGRGVRFRKMTTSAMLDISDKYGTGGRAAKATAAFCLVAITRGPVPEARDDSGALDVEATLAAIEQGAGGGWMTVTEEDMARAEGERSFAELFDDEPGDFKALSEAIGEESGLGNLKGATTARLRVRSAAQ